MREVLGGEKRAQGVQGRVWMVVLEGEGSLSVDGRAESRFFPSPTSPPAFVMDAQKQLQALSEEFQQLQTGACSI